MWNAGLDEWQPGIKIAGKNMNSLRYADDTTVMAESEEALKSLLMKVKGEWKSWLRTQHSKIYAHSIWSYLFMTSINRRGKSGAVTDLIFLVSKITVDGNCSHEIRRRLLPGRETVTNLESVLKSRDVTLLTKVCIVKAMVFPAVMYGCESWTMKKAEHKRIDAFWIVVKTWESLGQQGDQTIQS